MEKMKVDNNRRVGPEGLDQWTFPNFFCPILCKSSASLSSYLGWSI